MYNEEFDLPYALSAVLYSYNNSPGIPIVHRGLHNCKIFKNNINPSVSAPIQPSKRQLTNDKLGHKTMGDISLTVVCATLIWIVSCIQ